MKKVLLQFIFLVLLMVMCTSPVFAFELGSPLQDVKVQDCKLAWQISQTYQMSIPANQIAYLRFSLSYGDVALLYGLADSSGSDPADIYALRFTDKLTWQAIATKLGVNLTDILPQTGDILHNAKLDTQYTTLQTEILSEQDKTTTGPANEPSKKTSTPVNDKVKQGHVFTPNQT